MNKIITASVLPIGVLLAFAAPAAAAPAGADSATQTINELRAQGFDVRISRFGNAPVPECSVAGVRQQPVPRQPFVVYDRDDINVFRIAPTPKVTVTLDCSA